MAAGSSKRVADLIDRLEVKTEAELVTPEYLSDVQQKLNAMVAPEAGTDAQYYQYVMELQALIYGGLGKDDEAQKCIEAAIEQAGSPKKLRSRLLSNYVRQNPSIFSERPSGESDEVGSFSAPPVPSGPGDLSRLSEREQEYMRTHGLGGTPEVDFLVRRPAKFAALFLVSFGFYNNYWFYKNWQAIRNASGRELSPFWRTVFYIFYLWPLFKAMILLAKSRGFKKRYSGGWLALAYVAVPVTIIPISLFLSSRLQFILIELAALGTYIVILLLVQQAAAFALAKQPKSKSRKRPINYVEYIFVTLGLLDAGLVFGIMLFSSQPYHSGLQQIRINNAKEQLVITADEYRACVSYVQQNRAKVNPSDKAAEKAYNASVEQCDKIGQLRNVAQQKYDAITRAK